MKCDELNAYHHELRHNEYAEVYLKYEVDEAIAELKAENAQLKKEIEFMHSNCKWYAGDGCARLLGEKLAIINENVELKAKIDKAIAERDGNQVCIDALKAKLENVQASAYAESVDAGMRERKLRRALYKACANWANCEKRINGRDAYVASGLDRAEDKFCKKAKLWENVERKCRAKAEEYK